MPGSSSVPEEAFKPICLAIGHLVFRWSFVESAANICVNAGYNHGIARTCFPEIPLPWRRRMKYIRRCLEAPELTHLAQDGKEILERAAPISNLRDFIVHGTLIKFTLADDPILLFSRFDKDKTKLTHKVSELRISVIDLAKKANDCCDLGSDFLKLAKCFQEAITSK